jgi:DNA-binding NarL/FixJ family response regulator
MTQAGKLRVLLADDEAHSRALMKAVISSMGYQVVGEATDGQAAVDLFRREKPDLLLLDFNMHTKTGDEVLAEILTQFPDALVIMLTSVTDMENVEKCISLGAANYIRKDTSITQIKDIIQETWKSSKRDQEKPHA